MIYVWIGLGALTAIVPYLVPVSDFERIRFRAVPPTDAVRKARLGV